MVKCKNCKSTNIGTRVNYPHGRKSKSVTTAYCKDCGSTVIEDTRWKGRGRRR